MSGTAKTIGTDAVWGPCDNANQALQLYYRVYALRSSLGDTEALAHLRKEGVQDRARRRWERWGRFCAAVEGAGELFGHLPFRQALKLTRMDENEQNKLAQRLNQLDMDLVEVVLQEASVNDGVRLASALFDGQLPKVTEASADAKTAEEASPDGLPALPSPPPPWVDEAPRGLWGAELEPDELHIEPMPARLEYQRVAQQIQADRAGFRCYCHNDTVHRELRKLADADVIEEAIVEAHQHQLWVLWRQSNVLQDILTTTKQINELPSPRV